jgi:hypothetical protein
MALDAERELTQWTAGIDVNRTLRMGTVGPRPGAAAASQHGYRGNKATPFNSTLLQYLT